MDVDSSVDEENERKRLEETETAVYYAIDKDNPRRLAQLLASGRVDANMSFSGIDPLGKALFWSPLHFCCEKGRRRCAELLLHAGANPDAGDRWCMTPLMYAVQTEWFDMAELMINAGASVDLQDSRGRTPLTLAVDCSEDVAVKMLCKADADVNVRDLVGRSPLWMAVSKDGHISQVKALLRNKMCEVNFADNREKRTALQAAIVYSLADRLEYVRMLLAAGSEVNHRDEANHNSMLNLLVKSKRLGQKRDEAEELEIATLLLDAGYQLDDVPYRSSWYKFGGTAIKMAAEHGATDIVQLFLDRGADPDIPDDCGVTPVLTAALNNNLQTCLVLVRTNCLLDVIGDVKLSAGVQRQLTALQGAIERHHFTVARLLLAAGASCDDYINNSSTQPPLHLFSDDDGCLFYAWLLDWMSSPAALSDLCIRTLRSVLRRPLREKLSTLPLPAFVRQCVMLDHILAHFQP